LLPSLSNSSISHFANHKNANALTNTASDIGEIIVSIIANNPLSKIIKPKDIDSIFFTISAIYEKIN